MFGVDYREPLESGTLTGYRNCRDKMINQILIPQCQRHRELKSVQRTQTRTRSRSTSNSGALNCLRNNSAQLPVSWFAPPVETGNHHNPRLFREEEYPIRKSPHAGAPPSLFDDRIMQRGHSNLLDCIRHRLREPLRKFRTDTFVPRQCFF